MTRTVAAACGCDIPWTEWGGPGAEDAPCRGHYVYCPEHGDTEIVEYDVLSVIANRLGIAGRNVNALVSGEVPLGQEVLAEIRQRFPDVEWDAYPAGEALVRAGVLTAEQGAWIDED